MTARSRADERTIAVVGATGAQGGGLAHAILDDPSGSFSLRALTRDPGSDKARALAARGAEVVQADLDDLASLGKAFAGAYGAYCVTNFWEHFSPEKELAQARNMAEAAAQAGVGHVIWSTLEDTRLQVPLDDARMPTLMGKYKVPHFDAKGEADNEFSERELPVTFLLTSYYWDNLVHLRMGPRRDASGAVVLALPMADKPLPGIAAADIGRCAYGVFKAGSKWLGRTVGVAGEHLTGRQMADALGEALGEPVRYDAVPFDIYRGFGFPGADDIGNMFQYKVEFNKAFCRARDPVFARSLHPGLLSFRGWLALNRAALTVEG